MFDICEALRDPLAWINTSHPDETMRPLPLDSGLLTVALNAWGKIKPSQLQPVIWRNWGKRGIYARISKHGNICCRILVGL